MNINWKLRLKNKATLLALIACVITFIFQILSMLGIASPVTEDQVMQVVGLIINILVVVGIVVDPTTSGTCDSKEALSYNKPK